MNVDLPQVGALHSAVPLGTDVTADIIVPKGSGPFPILVYLHGGAWICGSPVTHRKLAHRFAEAGFLVLNVDYRLAPEHPFPTPLEDCIGAIRWAAREAARWGGDSARIAVGGDSAGGNLAAAAAVALHGGEVQPKACLLIYGVFDFARLDEDTAGFDAMAAGVPPELGEKLKRLMVESYLGASPTAATLADPRVSPVHAANRLPPTHLVVGSADPLVLQARALAERLASAGVEHELFVDEGMPHGYVQMEFLAPARPAIDRMVAFLRKHV
jgi:acetyl esterase